MHSGRRRSWDQLIADPGKKIGTEFIAKALHLQADCRRRKVHSLGRFGHAEGGHHNPESFQLAQFHGATLYDASVVVSTILERWIYGAKDFAKPVAATAWLAPETERCHQRKTITE